jgi:hypothetical protein
MKRVRVRVVVGLGVVLLGAVLAGQTSPAVGAASVPPLGRAANVPTGITRQTTAPLASPQVRVSDRAGVPPSGRPPAGWLGADASADRGSGSTATSADSQGPVATITPAAPASVVTFGGLTRVSAGTYPPDTQVGAVGSHVIEGANHAYRLLSNSGTVLSTMSFDTFFGQPGNAFLYDPRVFYDRTGSRKRFYVLALEREGSSDADGVSRIWLGVSRSSEPTSLASNQWCRYGINAKFQAGTADSSWLDFAGIGFGPNTVAISGNQYRWATGEAGGFTYDVVRVWDKNVLTNNSASCPSISSWSFKGSATAGDGNAYTIQPTQEYTAPTSFSGQANPIYFVNTEAPPTSVYRVWRIANIATGTPTFTYVRATGNYTFSGPPDSPQKGATGVRLATGFGQVLQVASVGNRLTAVHATKCFTSASCVRAVRFTVGQNTTGAMTASVTQQSTFGGGDGVFYYHPSVALNNAYTTAIAFQYSSANSYLSTGYALKAETATSYSAGTLNAGTCTDFADYQADPEWNKVRTGDYTGAQTDPDDVTSFWLAGERAAVVNGTCQWATTIGSITP